MTIHRNNPIITGLYTLNEPILVNVLGGLVVRPETSNPDTMFKSKCHGFEPHRTHVFFFSISVHLFFFICFILYKLYEFLLLHMLIIYDLQRYSSIGDGFNSKESVFPCYQPFDDNPGYATPNVPLK